MGCCNVLVCYPTDSIIKHFLILRAKHLFHISDCCLVSYYAVLYACCSSVSSETTHNTTCLICYTFNCLFGLRHYITLHYITQNIRCHEQSKLSVTFSSACHIPDRQSSNYGNHGNRVMIQLVSTIWL